VEDIPAVEDIQAAVEEGSLAAVEDIQAAAENPAEDNQAAGDNQAAEHIPAAGRAEAEQILVGSFPFYWFFLSLCNVATTRYYLLCFSQNLL